MPTATIRSTNNVVAGRKVVDIAKKIDVLEPDSAPLTLLTKKIDKRVAVNPEFKWMEEESLTKTDQVNDGTGMNGSDTTMAVDNGSRFRAGDVVKVPRTGENVLVTAVATNDLTVVRGWGSTAGAAIVDNEPIIIIGNANQEHATKRAMIIGDQTIRTNYTQIFRTPFGISRTAANTEMYGGKDLAHIRMMQLIEHQKEIERAFWFGEPKEDLTGTHPRRATGGVDYWISTNATDAGGALTQIEFNTFLRTGFRYGSKKKWLFAAPIVVEAISYWAAQKLQVSVNEKTFGISVMEYLTPFGTVSIVNMNLFTEVTLYAGYAYLIDVEGLSYRYLENSDTKLKTNIQANDADGQEDEYITECGLQFNNEKKSALLYNVTSYS
jgi:hypothetical protein